MRAVSAYRSVKNGHYYVMPVYNRG